ncbi:hypothetical protein L596_027085 [Steinernema carpocapsae]|uniref:Uncharacterized protein n=1 Tax=Steinernema carpocapsae TaxID=34508 RepID=A0A4U5M3B1_STECR|nr:hypothetical protein L596_027085 [Steinernema carpocapsae]
MSITRKKGFGVVVPSRQEKRAPLRGGVDTGAVADGRRKTKVALKERHPSGWEEGGRPAAPNVYEKLRRPVTREL